MGAMKKRAETVAYSLLRRAGVAEAGLAERSKKVGRGCLLGSILLIVPLIVWEAPLALKIVLQVGYAGMMYLGILLAFDDEKKA